MATQQLVPALWFASEALKAAEFYVATFPDSALVRTTRWPPGGPGPQGAVLTVEFELFGQSVTAMNGGVDKPFTEALSMTVLCDTQDEIDRYWDTLLAGGGAPARCGWLTDRYGLSWQIVPTILRDLLNDPDPARAARVVAAMLQMVKLDIATLQSAPNG
ncbi:VOC family protein [Acuticoccus sp. I52.16.1]|uniref:VOC family protein n=1 Tax=Acuticoccus sp. I52.16.1 TaxID=2928472 RepID=UPI001FD004C0|nr:VOC family protein [Acuticoccus sp. I52.16.1]UOM35489.1 VOC family protein [Acuticoccus sp. I52.16.1]